jgi:HK97 family phage major capsid protein
MTLAVGTGGVPVYMPAGGGAGMPYSTLFGRPVIPVEQCPALGDKGDIMLVDPTQYVLVDKGSINEASSIGVRFEYAETAFRAVYRVDGMSTWNSAVTQYRGGETVSPFVCLAARA